MMEFAIRVAKIQRQEGRYFAIDQPLTATSWKMPAMTGLRALSGMFSVDLHMCAYGMKSRDSEGEVRLLKPTRLVTNMPTIASNAGRRCRGCD